MVDVKKETVAFSIGIMVKLFAGSIVNPAGGLSGKRNLD